MQIVIDLPKETYKRFIDEWTETTDVLHAVRNGTPLSKGHGRLIDADELYHKMGEWLKLSHKADESVMVALDDIAISTIMEIEEAPTIIEADRGE